MHQSAQPIEAGGRTLIDAVNGALEKFANARTVPMVVPQTDTSKDAMDRLALLWPSIARDDWRVVSVETTRVELRVDKHR